MIVVIGYGVTGRAVEQSLVALGAEVVVVDDAPHRAPQTLDTTTALHRLTDADLVVASPGVPLSHPIAAEARARDIPISSEIDLATQRCSASLVAVTGTNGKSTVVTLIADMLEASGLAATSAGNIGRPLVEVVEESWDIIVVEVSSFQLAWSEEFHPSISVLLNISDDHLDWHGSFDAYAAAKARIFARQTSDDILVYNADDPVVADVAARASARRVAFSLGDGIVGGIAVPEHVDPVNALAASSAARAAGASERGIREGLALFERLPHRLAPVGEAGGVRWIDDSKATNPHATNHAIARFDSVVLIAGGRNKCLDLTLLRRNEGRIRCVVAMGESATQIATAFEGSQVSVHSADSMASAVARAAEVATEGDTVLLSPACTSHDVYRSYGERGDDFASEVHALLGSTRRAGA
jgi:UDP-N-acetylmuramoylalanine--D-glutamate ligase